MNSFLRQSTASQTRIIGPFVDDTDFKTLETGLTIANTDIKLSINGGASANKNSGGGTHIVNGTYSVTFDATDTATVGELSVSVLVSGALPQKHTFWVLEEAIYDAKYGSGATGLLPANVTQVAGQTASASAAVDFDDIATIEAVTTAIGATGTGLTAIPPVTVATNNDKTGYSLTPTTGLGNQTANITGNISGSVGSVTGNLGGNVVGSVGSISGVTFPTNFAALGINVSGHISRVTLVDTTTTNTDMRGTDSALLAANTPTNFSDMAIAATTGYVSVGSVGVNAVTGPNDFKADVSALALQSTLTTVAGYLDTEIAAILEDTGTTLPGLIATIDGNVDAVKAKTDQLAFTVANQVDANALSGGGGLDAAGMRDAIGMASADMDTQLSNIQIGVDGISVSASPTLLQTTTIATLASQTSFTLTAGSPDNDAYNTAIAIIVDQATSTQKTVVNISNYIGSTRTVTLSESPKFEITTGDTVYIVATSKTTLTDDVVNSLTGTVTRFVGPVWTGSGWDRDFIKGDSYLGGLAVNITIDNWAGDQLISAASEIKLSGTRTVNGTTTSFEWSITPGNVTVSGTTTTIPVELSSADTNITAGEYTADLRATWTSPAETVSLLQPKFKLRVVDPVSTF